MRSELLGAACGLLVAADLGVAAELYHLGRPPSPEELAAWNIDVRADGQGLPPGRGTVKEGRKIYAELCAQCHGSRGEGGPMDRLAGGSDSLQSSAPVRTVGSYWPYATTLFDYIRRAMPFDAPQSLSPDQVYAVAAFVLYLNHILPDDAALDASNLASVGMPNLSGFSSSDPRPDVDNKPCLQGCSPL